MPFFDGSLNKCGVDYHKWEEAKIRPVKVVSKVGTDMLPSLPDSQTLESVLRKVPV
jgi:hypothetical protein